MNSVIKREIVDKFRTGHSLVTLSSEYGYPIQTIKRAINPNQPRTEISRITVVKITKKDRQKEAGRKAAITRKLNKQKSIDPWSLIEEITLKLELLKQILKK